MAFRDEFPVLERIAYLNAGTDGPIPRAAIELAQRELAAELEDGRLWPHFERRHATLTDDLRAGYAQLLGGEPDDVAVTSGTSFGLGMRAGRDGDRAGRRDRHLRLRAPGAARAADRRPPPRRDGARGAVRRARQRGRRDDDARRRLARELDHGRGRARRARRRAGPGDPRRRAGRGRGRRSTSQALGCVAYAAAGQKWLCGADGTGMLWLDPEFGERVRTIAPGYAAFEDASRGLESTLRAGGRRFDGALSREAVAFSLAALEVLVAPTSTRRWSGPPTWPTRFATALAEPGYTVAARGRSTLVSFEYPDPPEARERLAEAGIAVRDLPGHAVHPRSRWAPGTTSPTSSACSRRCEVRLRLLRVERRLGPRLPRSRRRSWRGRSPSAACGSSTAARWSG